MTVTVTQFIIWIIIAAIVGFLGELISGRRAPRWHSGGHYGGPLCDFLDRRLFPFSHRG